MIEIKDIEYIAKLAKLDLSDNEKALYAKQLDSIVSHFKELSKIDTTNCEPLSHPLTITNVMRADHVIDTDTFAELAKNIPDTEGRFFKVPKI